MNNKDKTKEVSGLLKEFKGKATCKEICEALVDADWDVEKAKKALNNKKTI